MHSLVFRTPGNCPDRLRAAITTALLLATLALAPHRSHAQPAQTPPGRITIEQVLHDALARHPLIEAAAARVQAARGARVTAGALPNPVFTYQVENAGFPGRNAPAGSIRETSTYATLPLEPLWQRWPRVRRADDDVRAVEADLALVRRDVGLGAARAFFRLALAQIGVRGAADLEDGLDSLVRYNRARVAEGRTAEGDLIRLEVERDRAATERAMQEVEMARARAALAPFLGDGTLSSALVAVVDDSALAAVGAAALPDASTFTARALTTRPDVLAARARARAAGAESSYQHTLLVRQLGATFGSKSTGGVQSMIAGVSLPIPIFDQNRGEIQRASGERLAAQLELAWIERRASSEVAGAYEATRILTASAARLRGGFLARAEESRRIAIAAYQDGAAPLLQVIDATRTVAEARLTYYRALYARQESLLDLNAAAGLDPAAAFSTISTTRDSAPATGDTP